MDDLIEEFGTPKDIVYDYIESMDIQQLTKGIGIHRIVKRTAIVVLCFVLAFFAIFNFSNYLAYLESVHTIVTESETIPGINRDAFFTHNLDLLKQLRRFLYFINNNWMFIGFEKQHRVRFCKCPRIVLSIVT